MTHATAMITRLANTNTARKEEASALEDRIDAIWEAYGDLYGTDIASDQRFISLCWGEAKSVESYGWLDNKGVKTDLWDKEIRLEALRDLFKEANVLFQEVKGTKHAKGAAYVRMFIAEKARDLGIAMRTYQPETADEDLEEKGRMASAWEKGAVMLEWMAKHAEKMSVKQLMTWNQRVNVRRKLEDEPENKLSYAHYVSLKIIFEGLLAEKANGKIQRMAEESVGNYVDQYNEYRCADRIDGKGDMPFDEQMDSEASLYGTQLSHNRWVSIIDLKKRISDDEMVLEGYMMCGEEGLGLKEGLENSIGQCVIALSRTEGNKAAAARLLDMHPSTFNNRIKKARTLLSERLEASEISSEEFTAAYAVIS